MKKMKRSHPYKITDRQAEKAWEILNGPGPIINRLEGLLEITTGAKGIYPIGRGFRNDINQILKAAKGSK